MTRSKPKRRVTKLESDRGTPGLRQHHTMVEEGTHQSRMGWDTTVLLFANEYRVPVLSPGMAATLAASFELGCSVLIFQIGRAHV